tara:strand:+ start:81 stop:236 length:156 start_codon:yes stop_codon:yes gene_type:complete
MEKQILPSIENFVNAVINSRHLDEQEMWDLVWHMAEQKVNRFRALDPARNR